MRLLIATNNAHKKRELAGIFSGHDVVTPSDLGLEFNVDETGESFLENALLKARALKSLVEPGGEADAYSSGHDDRQTIIVADDSGLCVDALGGGPGVYSARFGSPDGGITELDAPSRNSLLLQSIAGAQTRAAHFVCCMVALVPGDRIVVAQESWHGLIAEEPSGAAGFGYDPVFYVPELAVTAAELPDERKNQLSHRGRASRVLLVALREALALEEDGGRA
ncbi:MAG: non-canonical purine NTP pyrophosphatase [Spirochaetota bacterium]